MKPHEISAACCAVYNELELLVGLYSLKSGAMPFSQFSAADQAAMLQEQKRICERQGVTEDDVRSTTLGAGVFIYPDP